jgi:hypothetical protein
MTETLSLHGTLAIVPELRGTPLGYQQTNCIGKRI